MSYRHLTLLERFELYELRFIDNQSLVGIGTIATVIGVGGFNAYAVEMALGARVVWMPTMHAANHLGFYGEAGYREQAAQRRLSDAKPLTVLEGDGTAQARICW